MRVITMMDLDRLESVLVPNHLADKYSPIRLEAGYRPLMSGSSPTLNWIVSRPLNVADRN